MRRADLRPVWAATQTIAALVALHLSAVASAQTDTTFTYQGSLGKSGAPVDGTADLRFRLYLAATGGAQLGTTQTALGVDVADGVFTVQLDFGVNSFNSFGAQPRWLEIDVREPAGSGSYVTLAPRQLVSRSPYSIQTRGIYVDGDHNVGIGTVAPQAPLHVREGQAATGLVAQASSSAVFERSANNYISLLSPTTSERGILFGDTTSIANGGIVFNNPSTPDGFEFRTGGNVTQMFLKSDGRLGLGTSTTLGQLSIADLGAPYGLTVASSSSTFPTLFATNTGVGPVLWAHGTADVGLSGGGLIVLGEESGPNIGLDRNEIMARDNGAASTLFLNAEGGEVAMGEHRIKAAYAYGKIGEDETLISASANVTGISWDSIGYWIHIDGGVRDTDVMIASDSYALGGAAIVARCYRDGNDLRIETWNPLSNWDGRGELSFVVFRP